MKLLWNDKDGGPESKVWMWGFESKRLFSVVVLRFAEGSREVFHTHAFNAISWVLNGGLREHVKCGQNIHWTVEYVKSWIPIFTDRARFHMVEGVGKDTWVLSFRGPWSRMWDEWDPKTSKATVLTHGRKVVL